MRLDQWIFEKGFVESREKARQEILAGRIREEKSGQVLDKPGMKVPKALSIYMESKARFVSRAGEKLEGLLSALGLEAESKFCLDIGSSTGGFTDCLLQRKASRVTCVDVGTHQLHEKLRADPRVQLFEQTDIRDFDIAGLEPQPNWVLIDVSFISVRYFLEKLVQELPSALFIILFKPQFEAGREAHRKKGVVQGLDRKKSLEEMLRFLPSVGLNPLMSLESALKGSKGNQESFIVASTKLPSEIFRTYDIRGHAEDQLSDEVFERIGAALAKRVGGNGPIGLGCDSRESSPRLKEAMIRGMSRFPVQVFDFGATSTPMVYFASHQFSLGASFQITASHNPACDNGLKMMLGKDTLFGEDIARIGLEAAEVDLSLNKHHDFKMEDKSSLLRDQYIGFLKSQFSFSKKFRLAVDTGNGMSGLVARSVYEDFCSDLEILYEEVDCRFPNHPADPTVASNLEDLRDLMLKKKGSFDMGFAFDGDGDRLGVITPKGRILWGDEILMLLSEKVLKEKPESSVIGEVKCSEKLFRMIQDRGGKPVMYRTGHSLIKKRMKELGAPIAGEMSGHLFFGDRFFGFDDAIYAGLRVMEVVDEFGLDLDEWIEAFPSGYITPEIRVDCPEDEKAEKVQLVKQHFEKQGEEISTIDGVRVRFKDGAWALVRASNTQAVLVLRVEAPSEERMLSIRDELFGLLRV